MIKLIYLTAIFVCGVLGETTEEDPVEAPKIVTLEEADKGVDTSEQHDPMFPAMNPYGMFGSGMNGYGMQENAVNFDFQCKCKAKSNLPVNLQVPTDANTAAQDQIRQLQDQVRRLNDQVRRTQEGRSNFEQFAQILSMADGLDCNCSGSSAPFSNFPYGGIGMPQVGGGFGQQMPFMGGRGMMGQRIFPGMFP